MTQAIQKYEAQIEKARPKFEAALPEDVSMDKFKQLCLNAIARDPNLQKCTTASVLQACMQCAEWVLWPGSGLSEAHLIPFGDKAIVIPDWKGLIKLALQHPAVLSLQAQVVHDGDDFDYGLGDSPFISHRPALSDRGGAIAVYAVAHLDGGVKDIEIMGFDEIEKTRKASKAGSRKDSPWVNWWGEMARKTILKRLMKRLPRSARATQAIEVDNHYEGLAKRDTSKLQPGRHKVGENSLVDGETAEENAVDAEYSETDVSDSEIPM